jgi:hypothetical protein
MSFKDILFAIPIAITYNVLIFKSIDILYKDEQCKDRYQKSAITLFVAAIIGIIIAQAFFNKNNSLSNRGVRFGLIGGSCLIIFYAVIKNWDFLDDITKLLIFGILFGMIILWSYIYSSEKKIKKSTIKKNNSSSKSNNSSSTKKVTFKYEDEDEDDDDD